MMGDVRRLKPFEPFVYHHDYNGGRYEESQGKEEPEEPLGIMPEVTAVIFLVTAHGFLAFFD